MLGVPKTTLRLWCTHSNYSRLQIKIIRGKKKMHGAESRKNQVQAPNPNGVYPML